ncbi:MAG: hypothetical protein ACP5XB_23190 [Isosphaeraceae bacterium]
MRRRIILAACVCAAVATGLATGAGHRNHRQAKAKRGTPGAPIIKGLEVPMRLPLANADPAQPVWAVNVLSGLNLDPQDQQLYQNMANVLTGVSAIPGPRATFWSAIAPSITGWAGSVSAVVPDGSGGYLVTVLTGPLVTLPDGTSPIAYLDYTEQWDVDANNIPTFVQSLDPYGESGQLPDLIRA